MYDYICMRVYIYTYQYLLFIHHSMITLISVCILHSLVSLPCLRHRGTYVCVLNFNIIKTAFAV